jgi:hypothetical protein
VAGVGEIGTILFLTTVATAASINQARVTYQQGKAAGRRAHRMGAYLAGERRARGAQERRRALARAQVQGASAGVPVGDATLGQIGTDIDRQTAFDVFGIEEETFRARFAARQQVQQAKLNALSAGLGAGSQVASAFDVSGGGGSYLGQYPGAGYSRRGSSFIGQGTGGYRLNTGTFSRQRYGSLGIY